MTSFYTANYLLSFGGTRNDLVAVWTNEDPTNTNKILLEYLKGIEIGSTTPPTSASTYKIGDQGLYFIKGLIVDPLSEYLMYLFTTDKNVNSGTFGVFKMDFSFTTP